MLENLKKEPVRKERDSVFRKDRENSVNVTRENLVEKLRKPPPTPSVKKHDRVERLGGKMLLAARKSFLQNYENEPQARSNNYGAMATMGDHQEKLVAAGIMEKVRMLQENQNYEPGNIPFEDICMFLYREVTPEFKERVKELEKKLSHSVSDRMNVLCVFATPCSCHLIRRTYVHYCVLYSHNSSCPV